MALLPSFRFRDFPGDSPLTALAINISTNGFVWLWTKTLVAASSSKNSLDLRICSPSPTAKPGLQVLLPNRPALFNRGFEGPNAIDCRDQRIGFVNWAHKESGQEVTPPRHQPSEVQVTLPASVTCVQKLHRLALEPPCQIQIAEGNRGFPGCLKFIGANTSCVLTTQGTWIGCWVIWDSPCPQSCPLDPV